MIKSLLIALTLLSNSALADKNNIIAGINTYFPNVTEQDINPTPFKGLYEVSHSKEPKIRRHLHFRRRSLFSPGRSDWPKNTKKSYTISIIKSG